jgi:hypothetical protein
VAETIFRATRGHPGLTRLSLIALQDAFMESSKVGERIATDDMVSFLMSGTFSNICSTTRTVPRGKRPEAQIPLIKQLLYSPMNKIEFPDDEELSKSAQELIASGIFAQIEGGTHLEFSAPLVQSIFISRLLSSQRVLVGKVDFKYFMEDCLARLNPKTLRDSRSIGADKHLLERQWQMEFYRTATAVLPANNNISPDVSRVFNSSGFLDFYVNGELQWAIELLREGNKADDHANRFEPKGLYYIMRKKIKQYAILDFRFEDIDKEDMKEHFWYIVYASDFSSVVVKRLNEEDLEIKQCNYHLF